MPAQEHFNVAQLFPAKSSSFPWPSERGKDKHQSTRIFSSLIFMGRVQRKEGFLGLVCQIDCLSFCWETTILTRQNNQRKIKIPTFNFYQLSVLRSGYIIFTDILNILDFGLSHSWDEQKKKYVNSSII